MSVLLSLGLTDTPPLSLPHTQQMALVIKKTFKCFPGTTAVDQAPIKVCLRIVGIVGSALLSTRFPSDFMGMTRSSEVTY